MGAGENPPLDRLRAAARLVDNHEAVARFAARGCGSQGRRPVSAPLSDPSAKPGEEFIPDVDAGGHGCAVSKSTLVPFNASSSNPLQSCRGIICPAKVPAQARDE